MRTAPGWRERLVGGSPFLGFGGAGELARARFVLMGAPLDATTSFRPGTRFAPARIRAVSEGLETFSWDLGHALPEEHLADLGDLVLPYGNPRAALEYVETAVGALLEDGRRVCLLGGEHLITLGAVRAAARRHPGLVVVQLDAHADLREEYLGEPLSHATVMRRILEVEGVSRVCQLGIRSGTADEYRFARERTRPARTSREAIEVIEGLAAAPVYLTIDIDVVDPGAAPGTGTPEPAGWSPSELLQVVEAASRLPVVACDLVEVSPPVDPADITCLLAARVVRELAILLGGG